MYGKTNYSNASQNKNTGRGGGWVGGNRDNGYNNRQSYRRPDDRRSDDRRLDNRRSDDRRPDDRRPDDRRPDDRRSDDRRSDDRRPDDRRLDNRRPDDRRPDDRRSDDRRSFDHRPNQTSESVHKQEDDYRDAPRAEDKNAPEYVKIGDNTVDIDLPESVDDFEEMTFLSPELFKGIHEYGFKYPSVIQSKTIHIINSGCDMIAQSQSGTGKTGAFAIGALSRVDTKSAYPQVVVVANTRLLALQIHKVIENLAMNMNINICACVGGHKTNSHSNIQDIRNAHILVGTPGRLVDMISKNAFDGTKIKTLIMDETDVLLHEDFRPQIEEIIRYMGQTTQICIFSATFTKDTLRTTENFLKNPYRVTVEKEKVSVKEVKQYIIDVNYDRNKFVTLQDMFEKLNISQMIIFVKSTRNAEELRDRLMDNNITAGMVHGKMTNIDRENVLKEFRLSYYNVMITTDVMCRGIDIDDLRMVINYDMPGDPETYIHRIGRSGRYGGQGIAINFRTYNDHNLVNILKREFMIDIDFLPDLEVINTYLTGIRPSTDKVLSSKNYSY